MARMIDANKAIEVVDAIWTVTGDTNVAKVWQQIKDLPTVDAVPVIRCRECKWYYMGGATCMFWDGANSMCGDDYCSRAERKDHE